MAPIYVGNGSRTDVFLIHHEREVRFLAGPITDQQLLNDLVSRQPLRPGEAVVIFQSSDVLERNNFLERLNSHR